MEDNVKVENTGWQLLVFQFGAPILVALLSFLFTIFAGRVGYEMTTMIVALAIGWSISIIILWFSSTRVRLKVVTVAVSVVFLFGAVRWEYTNDRPILKPQIAQVVLQSDSGTVLRVAPEIAITNKGKQPGNAQDWKLALIIDGSRTEGVQTFGQTSPSSGASEAEITSQDFPVGKPIRGWLFFDFATISHEYAELNLICGSPMLGKIMVQVSVSDSKERQESVETQSLKDLGPDACIKPKANIQVAPTTHVKKILKPSEPLVPITTIIAPNGIGISGGTVINPTVNNGPPPLAITYTSRERPPEDDLYPFYKEVIVVPNVSWQPIAVVVRCSGPIGAIGGSVGGIAYRGDGYSDPTDPRIGYVTLAGPVVAPGQRLTIGISSLHSLTVQSVELSKVKPRRNVLDPPE